MAIDSAPAEIETTGFQAFAEIDHPATSELRQTADASVLSRFGSSRWAPAGILLASVFVTLVFWRVLPSSFRMNEQSDYPGFYKPVAESILAGRGFARGDENPATAYPPGYSLVLAGTFKLSNWLGVSEEFGLSAVAALGMALATVFLFLMARDLFGPLPALVSAIIWMTYPFALWLTKQPNSEIPFMAVFYGGLCLFWYALARRKSAPVYFWCGLIFGFAMLIRPIAIGIAVVLSLIIWLVRRELSIGARGLLIAMLLLGNFVAVFPWEAWVYHKTGQVIPLSASGIKGMRDGLTFAVTSKGYREESGVSPDVTEVMKDILAQADQITSVGQLSSVVAREFRSHPTAVTKLFLLKIARSWYGTDSGRKEWPILLIQLGYFVLFSWAGWQGWKRGGINKSFVVGSLLIVVYFWGMTFLALSILRYMAPAVGLLAVLIAAGFPRRVHPESLQLAKTTWP